MNKSSVIYSYFFLAGHETTASTLVAALYYLSLNPEIQEDAFREVATVLQKEDNIIDSEKIEKLILVEAIIRETIRLHTAVAVLSFRKNKQDTSLLGYRIPKDTRVVINTIAAHHSSKYWDDPKVFRPSRFLGEERKHSLHKIFAFATGPRMCLGHKFAVLEAITCLTLILKNYSFTVVPNFKWNSKILAITRQPEGGLPLIMKRRD